MPPIEVTTPKKESADIVGIQALASILNTALGTGGDLIKELIRTAQSNPIVGLFLVYLLTDMMSDIQVGTVTTPAVILDGVVITPAQTSPKYLLHGDSVAAIKIIVGAGAGITITQELLDAIGSVIPLTGVATGAKPTLFTPSATTLVNAPDKFDISKEV